MIIDIQCPCAGHCNVHTRVNVVGSGDCAAATAWVDPTQAIFGSLEKSSQFLAQTALEAECLVVGT